MAGRSSCGALSRRLSCRTPRPARAMTDSATPTAPRERRPARGPSASASETFRLRLADELGAHRFGLWFENGTTATARDGHVEVRAANAYVADWIGRHFREAMQRAAASALGGEATCSVSVAEAAGPDGDASRDGTAVAAPATRTSGVLAGRTAAGGPDEPRRRSCDPARGGRASAFRRLEDFVVGDSNRLAFAASEQFGSGAADAPSIIFLHGECGVGKTHLLQGICRRALERGPRGSIRYVTAEQFTNEYIAAVRDGSLGDFRKRLRRVDLLAIDDVHFFANKSATQSEFLHTIDAIDLSGARIALVSDEHPRHIRRFSQSLVSRFLSGMVVRIERPDRETRSELVRRLARARGIELSAAAEDAVAGRSVGSVREIEGAITRLAALADLEGVRGMIGPGTVERLLGSDAQSTSTGTPVRLTTVVEAVCEALRVTRDDVFGSGRHARTVVARGLAAHLARELTTHSYPEIARALGRDTHSAVHTAARRIRSMLDEDAKVPSGGESLRETCDQLRHRLTRGQRRPDSTS